jgi:hypothetical protein
MAKKKTADRTSLPNASRKAKMRTLTLTDSTWTELTELARVVGRSRSAMVEFLVASASVRKNARPGK